MRLARMDFKMALFCLSPLVDHSSTSSLWHHLPEEITEVGAFSAGFVYQTIIERETDMQTDRLTDIKKRTGTLTDRHRKTTTQRNTEISKQRCMDYTRDTTSCFCLSPCLSAPQLWVHPSLVRAVAGGRDGPHRGPTSPSGIGVAHPGLHLTEWPTETPPHTHRCCALEAVRSDVKGGACVKEREGGGEGKVLRRKVNKKVWKIVTKEILRRKKSCELMSWEKREREREREKIRLWRWK